MLKTLVLSSVIFLQCFTLNTVFAEESPTKSANIPIVEKAFVDAINGFDKAQIIAQFGEPAKADDVKVKGTNKIVASIWQYHNINKSEEGVFFETTELDFIDDKVVQVVFLNNNGEDIAAAEEGRKYDIPADITAP